MLVPRTGLEKLAHDYTRILLLSKFFLFVQLHSRGPSLQRHAEVLKCYVISESLEVYRQNVDT